MFHDYMQASFIVLVLIRSNNIYRLLPIKKIPLKAWLDQVDTFAREGIVGLAPCTYLFTSSSEEVSKTDGQITQHLTSWSIS